MYSVHLDFDGKFQEYGLQVGSMVEGVSRGEMGLVALTTKIPIVSYLNIFLPFVLAYSFPEQLITDKGQEWVLIVFVCQLLQARYRPHVVRSMHRAVEQSKCVHLRPAEDSATRRTCWRRIPCAFDSCTHRFNTRVEKFNYEINVRCYIPVRKLTNAMEEASTLDKANAARGVAGTHRSHDSGTHTVGATADGQPDTQLTAECKNQESKMPKIDRGYSTLKKRIFA